MFEMTRHPGDLINIWCWRRWWDARRRRWGDVRRVLSGTLEPVHLHLSASGSCTPNQNPPVPSFKMSKCQIVQYACRCLSMNVTCHFILCLYPGAGLTGVSLAPRLQGTSSVNLD